MSDASTLLFSAMKNEGPFVLEWVAYHLAIGFAEIVVITNDCDDGSAELLDAMAAGGYLTHQTQVVPPDEAPQAAAAQIFESTFDLAGKWVLWLDGDEFLNVHVGNGDLPALLAELDQADGMAINWRVFGTSDMNIWQGENITERQTRCADRSYRPHQAVKTLFRYGQNFTKMDIHAPLAASDRENSFFLIDSGGNKIAQRAFFYDNEGNPRYRARMRNVLNIHKLAQINHYALRSRESFAFKSIRGDGAMTAIENESRGAENPGVKFRHGKKFWRKYDQNDCRDDSILQSQTRTKRLMADMLAQPEIKEAYDNCYAQFVENRGVLERKLGFDLQKVKRWEFLSALG